LQAGKPTQVKKAGTLVTLHQILKRIPILSVLDDADLKRLERSLIRRQYTKGQTIFNMGDGGGTLYIIMRGRVKVFISSPQGGELVLTTLSPGQILGELSFIDGKTRSASAEALDKTEVLALLREDFLALLRVRFDLVLKVLEILAHRLRVTDKLLADTHFQGITSLVAKRVMDMSKVFGIKRKT
jgi:CRP/FNR family cyclic AMP-dependent transcriptional regulator